LPYLRRKSKKLLLLFVEFLLRYRALFGKTLKVFNNSHLSLSDSVLLLELSEPFALASRPYRFPFKETDGQEDDKEKRGDVVG